MTLKPRPKDRVLPFRRIVCTQCGKEEMRKGGNARHCFSCADSLRQASQAAKSKGVGRGGKKGNNAKPWKEGTKYFIGPPKPSTLNRFVCVECKTEKPASEKGRAFGYSFRCAACSESASREIEYRQKHPKPRNAWTEWRLENFLRFVDKNGG